MSAYHCKACGYASARWFSQCVGCAAWGKCASGDPTVGDTAAVVAPAFQRLYEYEARVRSPRAAEPATSTYMHHALAPATKPMKITDVDLALVARILTGIEPLDRVLGSETPGFAQGSAVLLSGSPGAGKSTLLIQALAALANAGYDVLYATGEESVGQVAGRAHRVCAAVERISLVAETDVDAIIQHARDLRPAFLVVDSVQTAICKDIKGAPGSVTQIKEVTRRITAFCKSENIICILVGHVNKDNKASGPRTLEHLVDVLLSLKVDEDTQIRTLGSYKNRFGSTQEFGSFIMGPKGLEPCETPADAAERWGDDDDLRFQPLAQELLNLYLLEGHHVPEWLKDRIGEALDFEAWVKS